MVSLPFPLWELLVVAGLSLLICVVSTALALESAALFVPAFLLFFPAALPRFPVLSVNEAIGLTLIVMVFGQTSANIGYWYRRQIDLVLAARVLRWTVPLAVLGRVLAYRLPATVLLLVFAGLLAGLSTVHLRHGLSERRTMSRGHARMNSWAIQLPTWTRLVVSGGGLVTGLVGLGVGPVTNTVLSRGTDIGVHRAIGTATLTLYLTVLAAAMTTLLLVPFGGLVGVAPSIPWSVATVVAPVVLFGGQLGPWINARLPERSIVRSLVGLYLLVAVVTVLRVVG